MNRRIFLETLGEVILGGAILGGEVSNNVINLFWETGTQSDNEELEENEKDTVPYDVAIDIDYSEFIKLFNFQTLIDTYNQCIIKNQTKTLRSSNVSIIVANPNIMNIRGISIERDWKKENIYVLCCQEDEIYGRYIKKDNDHYIIINPTNIDKHNFQINKTDLINAIIYQEIYHAITNIHDEFEEARSEYITLKYLHKDDKIKRLKLRSDIPIQSILWQNNNKFDHHYNKFFDLLEKSILLIVSKTTLEDRLKKWNSNQVYGDLIKPQEYEKILAIYNKYINTED